MTQNEIEIQERQVLLSPKIRKDMDNIEVPSKLHHHIQSSLFFPIPGWLCCQKNAYMVRIYKHYWLWQLPVIILNITLILIWNYTHNSKHPIIQLTELGYLAVGPVLCCALIRDKIFLWIIYWIIKQTVKLTCFTKEGRYHLFRSADCIGGLHSSFGVTGLIWNIIYAFGTYHRERYINWRVSTAFCLPIIFISICLIALPCFRHWFHNSFERIHRYLSWFSLIVLIIHVILVNIHQYNMNLLTWNDFYKNTPIIFTIFLIIITIYPWLIIHYIKGNNIKVYPANKSVAIILPIKSPIGSVCKISLDWIEFHVMGICPFGNTKDEAKSLILMKNLGDWTGYILHKSLNGDIYNHNFWCHRIKSPNFTQGLYNWNRVFFMVTGSGIAPIIPYIKFPIPNLEIELVWVERDIDKNYPKIITDLFRNTKGIQFYDTGIKPRLDLEKYVLKRALKFRAEAVFIVSSPTKAYSISKYVTTNGIPAFASNFDV